MQTDVLVAQLDPIWREATSLRPGLSGSQLTPGISEEPEARLHRNIVEIRDAMIDPRVTFTIDDAERTLLERAESHLLGLKTPRMNRRKPDDVETKAESLSGSPALLVHVSGLALRCSGRAQQLWDG